MVSWTTSKLKSFVEYSLSKGATLTEVKEGLLKSGWSKRIVDKIFLSKSLKKMAQPPVIRVDAVSKSFNGVSILDSVSFDVKSGEILGVIGLSGSGKTTLLNLMVGFIQPDSGDASLRADDDKFYSVYNQPDLVKKKVGFATQDPSFYSRLTVFENVAYFASLYGLGKIAVKKRAESLVRLMALKEYETRSAKDLSGGMKKRLDIACALVHNPKVLILDEPTADLDPIACEEMWQLINQIKKQGTTVIIASHFLDELENVCDRIAVLHKKKISEVGAPEDLRNIYSRNYEVDFKVESCRYDDLIGMLLQNKSLEIAKTMKKCGRAKVFTPHPRKTMQYLGEVIDKSKEVMIDANIRKPTLKEYFESLVKK